MRKKYKRSTKICMAGFRTCLVKCPLQYTVLFLFGHQKSATLPPFFDTTLLKFQIFQSLLILGLTQPWNCCMYSSDIAQGFAARALWIFAVFSPFLKFHNGIKALAKLHINFYFNNCNLLQSFFDCEVRSGLWSISFSFSDTLTSLING